MNDFEMIASWLADMFKREISEAEATAENDNIWSLGSSDPKDILMHKRNSETMIKYSNFLTKLANECLKTKNIMEIYLSLDN